MGRIITTNPYAARDQVMHTAGGDIVLETRYDAEPVVERAKAHRDHLFPGNYRGTKELGMTLAGVLPLTLWMKLHRDGVLKDPKALQRWLNDNPAFKAAPGNAISMARR